MPLLTQSPLGLRAKACGGWALLAGLSLLLCGAAAPVQAQFAKEYDLKAAFLFNFTQFVEWPAAALGAPEEPFVIGVLGEDPFGAALDDIVRNETVARRKLVVRRFKSVEDVQRCQVLFIAKSQAANAAHIFATTRGRHLLTVGETDEVASHGGVIQFLTDKARVRVRINVDAAKEAGLTISSKLLRLAEVVRNPPKP